MAPLSMVDRYSGNELMKAMGVARMLVKEAEETRASISDFPGGKDRLVNAYEYLYRMLSMLVWLSIGGNDLQTALYLANKSKPEEVNE